MDLSNVCRNFQLCKETQVEVTVNYHWLHAVHSMFHEHVITALSCGNITPKRKINLSHLVSKLWRIMWTFATFYLILYFDLCFMLCAFADTPIMKTCRFILQTLKEDTHGASFFKCFVIICNFPFFQIMHIITPSDMFSSTATASSGVGSHIIQTDKSGSHTCKPLEK